MSPILLVITIFIIIKVVTSKLIMNIVEVSIYSLDTIIHFYPSPIFWTKITTTPSLRVESRRLLWFEINYSRKTFCSISLCLPTYYQKVLNAQQATSNLNHLQFFVCIALLKKGGLIVHWLKVIWLPICSISSIGLDSLSLWVNRLMVDSHTKVNRESLKTIMFTNEFSCLLGTVAIEWASQNFEINQKNLD